MSLRTIGIVAEGPRDYDIFIEIIEMLVPDTFRYLPIQPSISETEGFGSHGAGWKGVLSWCEQFTETRDLIEYLDSYYPQIDTLIVHVDADISRESEIDCYRSCPDAQTTVNLLKSLFVLIPALIMVHNLVLYCQFFPMIQVFLSNVEREMLRSQTLSFHLVDQDDQSIDITHLYG